MRGVDDELAEGLLERLLEPQRVEPAGRDPARRGLPLADLVAVDDEHVGAAAGQLARDRQAGEAGAADQHVAVAIERRRSSPRLVARRGIVELMIGRSGRGCGLIASLRLSSDAAHVSNGNSDPSRRTIRTPRSSKAPTASCSRSTARSSPTTTPRSIPSRRETSSPATSSGSTTTRSSSTSATSPRASSPPASCRSASRSIPSDEV